MSSILHLFTYLSTKRLAGRYLRAPPSRRSTINQFPIHRGQTRERQAPGQDWPLITAAFNPRADTGHEGRGRESELGASARTGLEHEERGQTEQSFAKRKRRAQPCESLPGSGPARNPAVNITRAPPTVITERGSIQNIGFFFALRVQYIPLYE